MGGVHGDAAASRCLGQACPLSPRAANSIEMITAYGYLPAKKKIMQWIGVDCGPAGPLLANPSDEQSVKLRAELDAAGFFEWINEYTTA